MTTIQTASKPENESEPREMGFHSTQDLIPSHDIGAASDLSPALRIVERSHYRIIGAVGQGGIGKVFSAHDNDLGRIVALKELHGDHAINALRFFREARLTARLQHPSIVPIYEAGCWPSGEPFYAMKLISGQTLLDAIDACPTLEKRLALVPHVLAVAEAIAYAHRQGVIHRDLKPANVIIGEFGETMVIDWGLAKDLRNETNESEENESSTSGIHPLENGLTVTGTILGTPAYMAPEQAMGQAADERADVYSIGAILYQTLGGKPPYEGTSVDDVVTNVLLGPPRRLDKLTNGIPLDLLAVVNKAMARKAELRYRNASELAEDLRRFQTGRIVGAHRYSAIERLQRFVKRHRTPVVVSLIAGLLLIFGAMVSVRGIVDAQRLAERKQQEAQEAEQRATARADELTIAQARASLDKDPTLSIALLKTLSPSWKEWGAVRIIAADAESRGIAKILRGHAAPVEDIAFSPNGKKLVSVGSDRRVILHDLDGGTTQSFSGHTDEVWRVAFSPDGRYLATGGRDAKIRLWDVSTGAARVLEGHAAGISSLNFSPDGRYLASRALREHVWLWDVMSGQGQVLSRSPEVRLNSRGRVVFSPNSQLLAFADDGRLILFDVTTRKRKEQGEIRHGGVEMAFSSSGGSIVTGDESGAVQLWDLSSDRAQTLYNHEGTRAPLVEFVNGDKSIVSGGSTGSIHLWDLLNAKRTRLSEHAGYITRMVVSRGGNQLATAGNDGIVRYWDIQENESHDYVGFLGPAETVAISSDNSQIAAAGADMTARIWRSTTHMTIANRGVTRWIAASPDGRNLAMLGRDGTIRNTNFHVSQSISQLSPEVHHFEWQGPPQNAQPLPPGMSYPPPIQFSRDGKQLALGYHDGTTRIFREDELEPHVITGKDEIFAIAFAPDGNHLITAGRNGILRLLEISTRSVTTIHQHNSDVRAVAYASNKNWVTSGAMDGSIMLTNTKSLETKVLPPQKGPISHLLFTAADSILVSVSMDRTLQIWTLSTEESRILPLTDGTIRRLVAFPDDSRFATIQGANQVRFWDARTGSSLGALRTKTSEVVEMAISPDSTRLLTGLQDGTIWLWDLASGNGRTISRNHGHAPIVAFGPGANSVILANFDGKIEMWPDDMPTSAPELRAWLDKATPETIDSLGKP